MMNELDIEWQKSEERREGLEQGLKQGRQEGRQEIAKNLKDKCVPIETISICTGLSVE